MPSNYVVTQRQKVLSCIILQCNKTNFRFIHKIQHKSRHTLFAFFTFYMIIKQQFINFFKKPYIKVQSIILLNTVLFVMNTSISSTENDRAVQNVSFYKNCFFNVSFNSIIHVSFNQINYVLRRNKNNFNRISFHVKWFLVVLNSSSTECVFLRNFIFQLF